jgi:ABC-2 type transport system ATP-binding protein
MSLLQTDCLSKQFSGFYAVNNVDITLHSGKVYGILGPNGSGKSTFMKMVSGLIHPSKGSIKVMDYPIGVETKKIVAYMSTDEYLYSSMSIKTIGNFYKDFYKDFDHNNFVKLINYMDLNMKQKVASLSTGMKAKLKVAVTMSRNAKLFMLDEPLNGVDIIAREKILTTIQEYKNHDSSLLISSHLVDEMEKILDYVFFIKNGSIVLEGDVEELKSTKEKTIVELYKEVFSC